MQESANIAYTWVRHMAGRFDVPVEFWEKNSIHLHVPAGATPKDGPSAGITLASGLFSPRQGQAPPPGHRHDGELSLVGVFLRSAASRRR